MKYRNILKAGMITRMVIFPMLTLVHANGWVEPPEPEVEPTISKAIIKAQSENRQLLLFFTNKSCDKCKDLEQVVREKSETPEFSKEFVAAIVDLDSFDGQACSQIYNVKDVPAVVVVQPDGLIQYKSGTACTMEELEAVFQNDPSIYKASSMTDDSVDEAGKSPSPGRYALQIGFFSSQTNAERLRQQANEAGFDQVDFDIEERDNKPHYRVLVGNFDDEQQAIKGKSALADAGFEARVHRRGP